MLLGYGSDRWWRVQVILMFAATAAIVALGAYHYVGAPVRVEISVVDTGVVDAPESTNELRAEIAFSNTGRRRIAVTGASLRLVGYDPPCRAVIPGRPSPESAAVQSLVLCSGEEERRSFRFCLGGDDVSGALGIGRSGSYVFDASLLVTVVGPRGTERRITVGGLTAAVEDGAFCRLNGPDTSVRYVGG